jgi:hypothetical protein
MRSEAAVTAIVCRGLRPAEREKVTRVGAAIARRFAALGHAVGVCQPVGEGEGRILCFLTAGGWNLGSVWARTLMDEPDETAAGVVNPWVGMRWRAAHAPHAARAPHTPTTAAGVGGRQVGQHEQGQ